MRTVGIIYIPLDLVIKIHDKEIAKTKGAEGIRNMDGLASAVEQPTASFGGDDLYPDLFLKAAVYAFHIAESQAFVDGNKRTALITAITFLDINGYTLPHSNKLYEAMIAIANKELDKEGLADLFRELVVEGLK
jgi:death on curing protein